MTDIITFSELIDRLITIDIKLYMLLEKSAEVDRKPDKKQADIELMAKFCGDNIRLAKLRSELKTAIDNKLNEAILHGQTKVLDEVKNYANVSNIK